MKDLKNLRLHIRKVLSEEVSNFIEKQAETETKQLNDTSSEQELGDPLDVKLNKMANELGSDGSNAPTVAVKAGESKTGDSALNGQKKAVFKDKTEQA